MRYDHHREPPLFAKAKQEFVKTLAGLGIQVAGRLVREQHERFVRECPCHRHALLFPTGQLPGLVGLSVVDPITSDQGWAFSDGPDCIPDNVGGAAYLHEIYTRAEPAYSGRVTVPVLWNKAENTIVNNESSEIIRMFNSAFERAGANAETADFYPQELRAEIDAINDVVYPNVNNGVYRCGFATSQDAYGEAFDRLFDCLDDLEARLAKQRYLVGGRLTEADWRLFSTLLRFDIVYYGNFKCNKKHVYEYPNLWNYTCELYQHPGIAEVTNLDHIKRGYYGLMPRTNPSGVVPKGPAIDFTQKHDRGRFS